MKLIGLQFFAASMSDDDFDDDLYDDFDDDLYDYDDNDELSADADDADPEIVPDDMSEDDAEPSDEGNDVDAELIAELRAMGLEGDDKKTLTESLKKRREAQNAKNDANEKAEAKRAGKAHVKSSTPGRAATPAGASGFTSRDVYEVAEALGCSPKHAREVLERRARAEAK